MSVTDAQAAAEQGLDPIVTALLAIEVPTTVENTGGGCMVVCVYDPNDDERWIGVTRYEGDDGTEDATARWTIVAYDGDNDPRLVFDGIDTDGAVPYCHGWLTGARTRGARS